MSPADHLDATLGALLADWQRRPFAWGTADCGAFAREAGWRLHGLVVDVPAYIGERDALRTLQRLGGWAGVLRAAGLQPREPVASAQRGDFVLWRCGDAGSVFGEGLALVTGVDAAAPGPVGLVSVSRGWWSSAWGRG